LEQFTKCLYLAPGQAHLHYTLSPYHPANNFAPVYPIVQDWMIQVFSEIVQLILVQEDIARLCLLFGVTQIYDTMDFLE
jgi:hypothetical protein